MDNVVPPKTLIDPFGRTVDYIRVSVTDRCDFRCVYCMAEHITFLPKAELLSLEELEQVCRNFMALGTRKIRLTGGEPLVRRNIMHLVRNLGNEVKAGNLDELTITTNGSQLHKMADELVDAGVKRLKPLIQTILIEFEWYSPCDLRRSQDSLHAHCSNPLGLLIFAFVNWPAISYA